MTPLPGQRNANDRITREFLDRTERERDARFLAGLRAALATEDGRFTLNEILRKAGIYTCVYEASGSAMYWNEGRRNYGLELKQFYEYADPERHDLMTTEYRQRQRQDEKALTALLRRREPAETPPRPTGGPVLTQDDLEAR